MSLECSKSALEEFIKTALNITELTYLIKKQIRDYYESGLSYYDIARVICYIIEHKKQYNLQETYTKGGIGLVKAFREEALNYYRREEEKKKKIQTTQQNIVAAMQHPVYVIECSSTDETKKSKRKFIDISEL